MLRVASTFPQTQDLNSLLIHVFADENLTLAPTNMRVHTYTEPETEELANELYARDQVCVSSVVDDEGMGRGNGMPTLLVLLQESKLVQILVDGRFHLGGHLPHKSHANACEPYGKQMLHQLASISIWAGLWPSSPPALLPYHVGFKIIEFLMV